MMIHNFYGLKFKVWILVLIVSGINFIDISDCHLTTFSKNDRILYKEKIRSMFHEAYDNYVLNAIDYDELMPISCTGMNTWGTFSLSLIDALDMLAIMNNHTEFRRVAQHILDTANFDTNTNVSVFETNIRVVGGLLSAHLLSRKAGFRIEDGWPCSGPLLRLAEVVAKKLLPAFDTPTGMPYGTVNFVHGVPDNETPITCTAGVGTFIVEFGALSRLTGDPIYEETALGALEALQRYRSKIGLLGNHINVLDGKWTATDAGIGAGVDSYFEYLVKGSIMLQMPSLIEVFRYDYGLIKNYFKRNDWFVWVSMATGSATMPIFQSLEAFFPGILTMIGELDQAKKSLYNYHQIWKQYGFVPEFYDIVHGKHHNKRDGYPLRPEFIESVYYLYQATKDVHLLSIGADVVDSIYYSARTGCGYATIKSVADHTIEDRMESFFLAETLKYLYLLFDEDNFINENGSTGLVVEVKPRNSSSTKKCVVESGGYVFNTEAHPIDIAALSCCWTGPTNLNKSDEDGTQDDEFLLFEDEIDLYDLIFESKISTTFPDQSSVMDADENSTSSTVQASTLEDSEASASPKVIMDPKTDDLDGANEKSSTYWLNSMMIWVTDNGTHCNIIEKILLNPFISVTNTKSSTLKSSENDHHSQSDTIAEPPSVIIISDVTNDSLVDDDNGDGQEFLTLFPQKDQAIRDDNFESLSCPSQSFLIRLSLYGQMFES